MPRSAFAASIARKEVIGLGGATFPEALSRARLGDPSVGEELVPLLGDARPEIRAEAALACAQMGYAAAVKVLSRLRKADPESRVRIASALAAWKLGDADAEAQVVDSLGDASMDLDLRAEVALALGEKGHVEAAAVLEELARDEEAEEGRRTHAVTLLGLLAQERSAPVLIALLADVRLRPFAAEALGRTGGEGVEATLAEALRTERYPEARAAEAHALVRLGDRGAAPMVVRFLGTESSVPGGLELISKSGKLHGAAIHGGRLGKLTRVRQGTFSCGEAGCMPGTGAALNISALGRLRGPRRLVVSVRSEKGGRLQLGQSAFDVAPGESQLSVLVDQSVDPSNFPVEGEHVTMDLVAVVLATEELPPPAPEPWDAGVEK